MEKISVTRQELYDLIWSTPISRLAKNYGILDYQLRKICKDFNIPVPQNGYWQKLKYNKPISKIALPPGKDEDKKIFLSSKGQENSETARFASKSSLDLILNDPKAPTVVPEVLTKPHFLTVETKRHWADFKLKRYEYDRSIPYLSIRVEKPNQKRALIFMDALVKLLEYREHKVIIKNNETLALLYGVEIQLDLREAGKRIPNPPGSYPTFEVVPTGELILKTGKYSIDKEWREGKILIEQMLPKIVTWMEGKAKDWAEMMANNELNRHNKKMQQELEAAKRALQEQELQSFNELLLDAERFNKAKMLRIYIEAFKEKALVNSPIAIETELWIQWALKRADWYDPLTNMENLPFEK
ncbi:hypothetical protein MH928_13775 [Flavobacterium sp. WW92]|uniref:hypothetical protein n=1 Tax=unclassified Flavobacterium TaxID=196869 RepID=UPI002225999D|nr:MULTISPECIES: hypothetical protein [unclassified Flavobacterium]WDO12388.1 hypothetical protein MH928_13775 [Flavobacterium sp. WW92]